MRIGFHTDAFNTSFRSFDACLEWAQKNDVHNIECGLIDGVSWIHGLGYQPHVALYEDPLLLRRKMESYGVQFSPVETGGIYAEPNELSVIAAKLCLEGYNVAGDSLYFVNPATGSTSWFRETRTFVVTLGDHDFYA